MYVMASISPLTSINYATLLEIVFDYFCCLIDVLSWDNLRF